MSIHCLPSRWVSWVFVQPYTQVIQACCHCVHGSSLHNTVQASQLSHNFTLLVNPLHQHFTYIICWTSQIYSSFHTLTILSIPCMHAFLPGTFFINCRHTIRNNNLKKNKSGTIVANANRAKCQGQKGKGQVYFKKIILLKISILHCLILLNNILF